MTKANFMAQRLEAWRDNQAKAQEALQKLNAKLAQAQAQLAQKQQAEIASGNTKVQAELEKVRHETALLAASPSYVVLSREAAQLASRYASAPPAEKAKLKQRAAELYNQLRQMERTCNSASTANGRTAGHLEHESTPNTSDWTPRPPMSRQSSAGTASTAAGPPTTQSASPMAGASAAGLKLAGPAINLPAPPQIQNFGVFPGPIPGGEKDVGEVVLTGVPLSGATVQLSSDQPSVASVPAQIQVSGSGPSAGSAVIVVNTLPVAKPTDVTLSAQVLGSSQASTTKLTVRPPQLSIFECWPAASGTPIACKVWLDGPVASTLASRAGAAPLNPGMPIQISTNNSEVFSVPGGRIFVPEGAISAEFQVPTTAYPEPVDVVISASSQGSTPQSAFVRLTAAAIRSFGCMTGEVARYVPNGSTGGSSCETAGGGGYTATTIAMTFSGPTPAGFVTVTSSGGAYLCNSQGCYPSLQVPLQTGAKWEAWDIVMDAVSVPTTTTLSARDPLSNLVKTVLLKIDPPSPRSVGFTSQSGASLTSISNVLAGGQQLQTYVVLNATVPGNGITFDVKYSASDAAGNSLSGAITGPSQITLTNSNTNNLQYFFNVTVQPCEVNAPCKVSVTIGSATGTLYVNP